MRYGSKFLMSFAVAAMLSFVGCVREIGAVEIPGGGDTPGGKVRIELLTPAPHYATPATRAGKADEDAIGEIPWVLVFAGEDDAAVYVEAARAYTSGGKKYVDLTAREGASRLLVLANGQAKFTAADAAAEYDFSADVFDELLEGETLAGACAMLHTRPLASPQPAVPFTGGALPMSGVATAQKIERGERIGVEMVRTVARITVENSAGNFTLTGATVTGAPRRTTLHRTGGNETIEANGGGADRTRYTEIAEAEENTTAGNPIYLYESPADGGMFLIVEGAYGGETNYYKLAFTGRSGGALDIVRNHDYSVEIESVLRKGYTSLDDAIAAEYASNEDMAATVTVTDPAVHDIVDNGRYYLGVSNSQYIFYADGALTGRVAFTVTTDCAEDVADNSITVSEGLTLTGREEIPLGGGEVGTQDVVIDIAEGFTSGTVTLRLGDLEKVVTVSRGGGAVGWRQPRPFTPDGANDYLSAELTAGENWLGLSGDGASDQSTYLHAPESGRVWIHAKSNYDPADVRPYGVVYLSRRDESRGRIKLDISQQPGVEPVLTVTPDALTFNNMGSWEDVTVTSIFADGGNTPVPYKVEYSLDGTNWHDEVSGLDFGTFDLTRADADFTDDWTYVFRTDLPAADAGGLNLTYTLDFESAPISTVENGEDAMRNIGTMGDVVDLAAGGETANCYVVNGPGRYSLPLVYGNGRIVSGALGASFVNHEGNRINSPNIANAHDAIVVWQDTRYLVVNPAVQGGNLTFDIQPGDIRQGNAVVAVRNAVGTILWSWHIWVTTTGIFNAKTTVTDPVTNQRPNPRDQIDYTEEMAGQVIPTTYRFMQHHLGWVGSKTTTYYPYSGTIRVRITQTIEDIEESRGETNLTRTIMVAQGGPTPVVTGDNAPYWQWGRKDPMPPAAGNAGEDNGVPGIPPERLIYWGREWETKILYGFKQQDPADMRRYGNYNGATFPGTGYYTYNRSTDFSLADAITRPDTFYNTAEEPAWPTIDTKPVAARNLWDADNTFIGPVTLADNDVVKTLYDPNPPGFKMPPANAFMRFTGGGIAEAGLNKQDPFRAGWYFYSTEQNAGGSTVFFPAMGHRRGFSGMSVDVTFGGNCWAAMPTYPTDPDGWAAKPETHGFNLGFDDGDGTVGGQGAGAGDYPWSYGLSVRPIVDTQ